jgi:hypothetical protein
MHGGVRDIYVSIFQSGLTCINPTNIFWGRFLIRYGDGKKA